MAGFSGLNIIRVNCNQSDDFIELKKIVWFCCSNARKPNNNSINNSESIEPIEIRALFSGFHDECNQNS